MHGNRGEDPTEGPVAGPTRGPPVSHEPRIAGDHRRPRGRRLPPLLRARAASCSTRPTGPQPLHPLRLVRRLPLPGPRQGRRRGHGRAARSATCPNVTLLVNAEVRQAGDRPVGPDGHRGGRQPRRRHRGPTRRTSWSCRAGAANSAKLLSVRQRPPPPGLANGSDQVGRNYMFHNCKAVVALGKEPNDDRLPEDPRASTTSISPARTATWPARATSR